MPTLGDSILPSIAEGQAPFRSAAPGSRVWILDDDEVLCSLLHRRLGQDRWSLRSFHTPEALETALESERPDLLVLDEMLPQKSGIQVLANLRLWGHRFPVLMLSALAEPHHRVTGLEAGADDYLGKPFLTRELQLRIERLLTHSPPTLSSARRDLPCFVLGKLHFDPGARTLRSPAGDVLVLSPGDTALLVAFCRSEGRILSREQMIQCCGSLVNSDQSRTIDVRIGKLRQHLRQLSGRKDLIQSVRGRGYRLHPEADVQTLHRDETD